MGVGCAWIRFWILDLLPARQLRVVVTPTYNYTTGRSSYSGARARGVVVGIDDGQTNGIIFIPFVCPSRSCGSVVGLIGREGCACVCPSIHPYICLQSGRRSVRRWPPARYELLLCIYGGPLSL